MVKYDCDIIDDNLIEPEVCPNEHLSFSYYCNPYFDLAPKLFTRLPALDSRR